MGGILMSKVPKKISAKRKAKTKMGKHWTKAEVRQLRISYKTKPASHIAKKLKRSLASVRAKLSALGVTKRETMQKANVPGIRPPKFAKAKAGFKKTARTKAKPKKIVKSKAKAKPKNIAKRKAKAKALKK